MPNDTWIADTPTNEVQTYDYRLTHRPRNILPGVVPNIPLERSSAGQAGEALALGAC